MPGKILAAIFFAVSFTFVYRSFSACVSALTFRKKKGGQFGRLFLLQFALLWTAFVGGPYLERLGPTSGLLCSRHGLCDQRL